MNIRLPATLQNLEAELDDTLELVVADVRSKRVEQLTALSSTRALNDAERRELRALLAAKAR